MISQLGLTPNLHTFGCAAMGCANRFDGLQLLKDMQVLSGISSEISNGKITSTFLDFR